MEIIEKYSKLHKELQLQEYAIPFKELDKIETKEEFIEYIIYYQIDEEYLLEQILECQYLEFLHEYMKDDIVKLLKTDCCYRLNDKNLKYINEYIEIIELNASRNINITTVKPFANSLKILCANLHCGIGDNGLKEAYNLEELNAEYNPSITTVKPFAKTLKKLNAGGFCGINDNGLKEAYNLEELYVGFNQKITTIKPFAKTLKILYAGGTSRIDDNSLLEASNLEELYASDNSKITTIKPFAKTLKILTACGYCGIDDKGLKETNLKQLYSYYNPKITIKIENIITKQ